MTEPRRHPQVVEQRHRKLLAASTIALLSLGCGSGSSKPKDPYTEAYENCMRYGGSNPMICETVARQQAGPQQGANTDAQWAELEKAAADRARQSGATEISPPARLSNVGFAVEHRLELLGGRCYDAAVAWRSGWKTAASVTFVAGEGGQPPNDNLNGRNLQIDSPAGLLHFCADHNGAANLSLSGIGSNGAILNKERLEYVVVVGVRTETPEQTEARRKEEAAAAAAGRARIETNLYMAELDRGGEALAKGCSRCRTLYHDCIAERKNPPGDLRPEESSPKRCVLHFEACAQGLGMDSSGRLLCGYPP